MKEFHRYFRRVFGSLAQGPAAIIARQGDEVVFTCDALGLRPIWFGSTEKEYFASSERGGSTRGDELRSSTAGARREDGIAAQSQSGC